MIPDPSDRSGRVAGRISSGGDPSPSHPGRLALVSTVAPRALTPARYGRPWGGGRFGRAGDEPVGEIWVSGDDATLPDGRTLAEAGIADAVPLVKILDVGAQLSVQVHPDDRLARELHGPRAVGKHEAWVVLEAAPDAALAFGLVDSEWVEDLYSGDRALVAAALATAPATAGMVVDVAPGTVHAPAAGVLLYEIQQRSDLTYRIFDWGRSRPLHLVEARRAMRPDTRVAIGELPDGEGAFSLIDAPAPFRLELCRPGDGQLELTLERPAVISPIRGELFVDEISIASGDHFLLEPGETSITGTGEALLAVWR
jgi:mannose-6-phosphate isomerase